MLRQVSEGETKQRREEYAALLERLAIEVRTTIRLPEALYIQMFWTDQSVTRAKISSDGFNLLRGIGAFECAKGELVNDVMTGSKVI